MSQQRLESTERLTPAGWRFADFELDVRMARLYRRAERIEIERSSFDVLRCLLSHAPDVVDKHTLLAAGWPGRVVSENSLPKAIGRLRRALGDEAAELIVSVHGYGYRLAAEPEALAEVAGSPVAPAAPDSVALEDEPAAADGHARPAADPLPAAKPAAQVHRKAWVKALALVLPVLLLVVATTLLRPWREPAEAALSHAQHGEVRIAVLPFRDLSEKGELALLAQGIGDHLWYDTQRVPGLDIIAPGLSARYREDGSNAEAIAAALGADIVVGGDLSNPGGRLRAELRVSNFRLGGTQRYQVERDLLDQATLLDDLTLAMFRALSPQDGQFGLSLARAKGTSNPQAYATFLRAATSFVDNNDPNSHRRTIAILEDAIRLDPEYADAWLMLGNILGGGGYYADTPEELYAGRQRALVAMDRGIELTPHDVFRYLERSEMRLLYQFDWRAAMADIDAARALPPVDRSEASIYIWEARFLASMNRIDDAIAAGAKANALSPKSGGRRNQGWHYLAKRDTHNARAVLKLQLVDLPESPHVHFYLALCDIFDGRPESALRQLEYSSPLFRLTGTAIAQYELGDRAASDAAIKALTDRYTPADGYWVATAHAWRGEADTAFAWLDYARRAGDNNLMYLPFDPLWHKLREDPRMQAWLRELAPPPDLLRRPF